MGHRQDDGQSDMAGVWNDLQALVREDGENSLNHFQGPSALSPQHKNY